MKGRAYRAITVSMLLMASLSAACTKGPDPWSPKTYKDEIGRYSVDRGALGPEWKKYEIKGMEDASFFYANDNYEGVITTTFTCGKYQDIPLSTLAEHLVIAMGKKYEVRESGYLPDPRVEVYHLLAEGTYQYHKETLYEDEGLVPDLYAPEVMDAYVIGEPHCVIDIVYTAPPEDYNKGVEDFHALLRSLDVPVAPPPEADAGTGEKR